MAAKVLITGGNGFIGSYTARRLESAGHAVIPIDVVPRSGELSLLPISTSTRILDVAAAGDVRELCRKEKVTHIFHAAHPPREENPQVLDFCLRAMRNVLETAKELRIRRVVFASSGAVYGPLRKADGKPIAEDAPISIYPAFLYRSAKILGEWLGNFYATHLDLSFVALRFSTVYGPGQGRGIPLAIKEGLLGRACRPYLTRSPDDLIYVEDVAESVCCACFSDRPLSPAYNIGAERAYTEADLGDAIRKALPGVSFELGKHPEATTTARYRDRDIMDIARARVELGFVPKVDLETGVRAIAEWVRKNRQGLQ